MRYIWILIILATGLSIEYQTHSSVARVIDSYQEGSCAACHR